MPWLSLSLLAIATKRLYVITYRKSKPFTLRARFLFYSVELSWKCCSLLNVSTELFFFLLGLCGGFCFVFFNTKIDWLSLPLVTHTKFISECKTPHLLQTSFLKGLNECLWCLWTQTFLLLPALVHISQFGLFSVDVKKKITFLFFFFYVKMFHLVSLTFKGNKGRFLLHIIGWGFWKLPFELQFALMLFREGGF